MKFSLLQKLHRVNNKSGFTQTNFLGVLLSTSKRHLNSIIQNNNQSYKSRNLSGFTQTNFLGVLLSTSKRHLNSIIQNHSHSYKRENLSGFTLLETLIAIAILSVAVATTFTAAQTGLLSSIESKNQVIGYYLGQEAIEYIRNKRDENSILQQPWLTGIAANASDPCYFGKICTVDVVQSILTACPTPLACPPLKQDSNSTSASYGMYGYGAGASWVNSNFTRSISITSINADEIAITVAITWFKGSYSKTFIFEELLFNWQS